MIKRRKKATQRRYRLKKKKSIFRKKLFWLVLFLFLFTDTMIYGLVFWEKTQVKGIEVLGNQEIEVTALKKTIEKNLEKKLGFLSSKSILLVNLKKIEQQISNEFPQVAQVTLKRKLPNLLSLVIEERKPVAAWCQINQNANPETEKCWVIDREGIAFDAEKGGGLMIVSAKGGDEIPPGQPVVQAQDLQTILAIAKSLREEKIEFEKFLYSKEKLTVQTQEGFEIYFDLRKDVASQITNLKLLLQKKISSEKQGTLEYIDLRFESRVFYK